MAVCVAREHDELPAVQLEVARKGLELEVAQLGVRQGCLQLFARKLSESAGGHPDLWDELDDQHWAGHAGVSFHTERALGGEATRLAIRGHISGDATRPRCHAIDP